MQVNFVPFPGSPQNLSFDSQPTVGDVLTQAGVDPENNTENMEVAVDGEVTSDLGQAVPDGSTVTRTKRVAGA